MSKLKVMSRRSTVTVRDQPVAPVTTATGPMTVHGQLFTVDTQERIELVDLTDRVMALVCEQPVREGVATLFSMHTTCTLFINEFQDALLSDMKAFLESVVDGETAWMHNDPEHSECSRANADSHLRAMLLGHTLTLQVTGGEVVLGQWQRILLAELDGARSRTLRLQVVGIV